MLEHDSDVQVETAPVQFPFILLAVVNNRTLVI
jgi:hypothetical protein